MLSTENIRGTIDIAAVFGPQIPIILVLAKKAKIQAKSSREQAKQKSVLSKPPISAENRLTSIPPELKGISPEAARNVMALANEKGIPISQALTLFVKEEIDSKKLDTAQEYGRQNKL